MPQKFFTYCFFIIVALSVSCSTGQSGEDAIADQNSPKSKKESLIKVNKYLVNSENKDIDNYVRRHGLDVVETGSGLRYQIIVHGNGEMAKKGKFATLNYKVKLITGDVVYSSDESGPKKFKIGHGGVESGLEEAILNMRAGERAIIIIPSHLAHGLLGDNNKIPQRSTIIYEMELTNIN